MGKTAALLFVLVILLLSFILSCRTTLAEEGSWTSLSPNRTARMGSGVAVVEDKIYAIGGNDEINPYLGTYLSTNEMYDPSTDTWTSKAPMPTPRRNFAIAVYKNKIYCISGESGYDPEGLGGIHSEVNEVYDPTTDTWETKASIPTPRYGMCTNVVDGKIYIMGGGLHSPYPVNTCSALNEVYDPETDTWTEKTSLPTSVLHAASAVVDDRIYVLGGQAGLFMGGWHDHNMVYDVKNDSWSMAAPIPVGCERAAAGATTGAYAAKRIYLFGGFIASSYTPRNLTQVYNPENDVWSRGDEMPAPRFNFGVAVVNDELYVISETHEKYTPADHEKNTSPAPSPEPFPTVPVAIVSATTVAVVSIGLLVYFRKRKR